MYEIGIVPNNNILDGPRSVCHMGTLHNTSRLDVGIDLIYI